MHGLTAMLSVSSQRSKHLLHQTNLNINRRLSIPGAAYFFSFSSPFSSIFSLKPWKLRGKVVSLQKKSCTRQIESKLSFRSFAFSLHKKSCTRQIESRLSLRSFAFSLPPNSLKKNFVYVKLGLKIMNLCESVKSVGVFYVPRISQIYTDFLCPGLAASAFTFPQSAV